MSFRRILVYVLAAAIGVAAAFLLLPDEAAETAQAPKAARSDTPSGQSDEVGPEAPEEDGPAQREKRKRGKRHASGGNPKAREIQKALDTPAHGLLARTSPVWVQVQRVLREQEDEDWLPEVEDLLLDFKEARREVELEAEALIERQNSLLESMWNAVDMPESLEQALKEPLSVLSERIQSFEN